MAAISVPQVDRVDQAGFLFRPTAGSKVDGRRKAGALLQGCTPSFQKPLRQAWDYSSRPAAEARGSASTVGALLGAGGPGALKPQW